MMIGGFLRILRGRLYVFFGGSFWIDGGGGARSRPEGLVVMVFLERGEGGAVAPCGRLEHKKNPRKRGFRGGMLMGSENLVMHVLVITWRR